jgi:hypothetical protein
MAQEIVSRHKHNMLPLLNATCLKLLVFISCKGKAQKEICAILTETSASFIPGRAKELSAPLYLREIFIDD